MGISADLAHRLKAALGGEGNAWIELTNYLNFKMYSALQYNTNSATGDVTVTAAQFAGSVQTVLNMTGTLGAGHNLTTPTAAQIFAQIPNCQLGQQYMLRIINSSGGNFSWTVLAGSGVSLNGTMTIAQNTTRDFLISITSPSAVSVQAIGTGTHS